jgi:hypothetical protein
MRGLTCGVRPPRSYGTARDQNERLSPFGGRPSLPTREVAHRKRAGSRGCGVRKYDLAANGADLDGGRVYAPHTNLRTPQGVINFGGTTAFRSRLVCRTTCGRGLRALAVATYADWKEEADPGPARGLARIRALEHCRDTPSPECPLDARDLRTAVDVRAGHAGGNGRERTRERREVAACPRGVREGAADRPTPKSPPLHAGAACAVRPDDDVQVGGLAGRAARDRGCDKSEEDTEEETRDQQASSSASETRSLR